MLTPDPLALSSVWGAIPGDQADITPLLGVNAVLETSWLRKGISRDHFLTELLTDLHQRRLVPLLAMLPKRWRLGATALPDHLRKLGELLEGGPISPLLLAALADDLHHLFPVQDNATRATADALKRWTATTVQLGPGAAGQPLPQSRQAWKEQADYGQHELAHNVAGGGLRQLGADLVWHKYCLHHLQSAASRWGNTLMAQVFNALAPITCRLASGAQAGATPPSFSKESARPSNCWCCWGHADGPAEPAFGPAWPVSGWVPAVRTPQRPPPGCRFRSLCPI